MNRQLTWPAIPYVKVIWKFVHEALTYIIPDVSPTWQLHALGKPIGVMLHLEAWNSQQ